MSGHSIPVIYRLECLLSPTVGVEVLGLERLLGLTVVWKFWRRGKSFVAAGNRSRIPHYYSL